jgi:predicted Zn-dependent protease
VVREKEEAFRILEAALSIASTGVDEAEVSLRGGGMGLVPFADNQIHPASQIACERLSVRLCRGGQWARVSTSDFSTAGITAAAQQARSELDRLPEVSGREALPVPQGYAEVDAFDHETAHMHVLERTALAARAITAAHRAGVVASGWVAVTRGALDRDGFPGVYAVANTRGLLAYHPATRAELEVRMVAG